MSPKKPGRHFGWPLGMRLGWWTLGLLLCCCAGGAAGASPATSPAELRQWFQQERPAWSQTQVDRTMAVVEDAVGRSGKSMAPKELSALYGDCQEYCAHVLPKSLRVASAIDVEAEELRIAVDGYFGRAPCTSSELAETQQQMEGVVRCVKDQLPLLLEAAGNRVDAKAKEALRDCAAQWERDLRAVAANRLFPVFKRPLTRDEYEKYLQDIRSRFQRVIAATPAEQLATKISSTPQQLFTGETIPKPVPDQRSSRLKELQRLAASERAKDNERLKQEDDARRLEKQALQQALLDEEFARRHPPLTADMYTLVRFLAALSLVALLLIAPYVVRVCRRRRTPSGRQ